MLNDRLDIRTDQPHGASFDCLRPLSCVADKKHCVAEEWRFLLNAAGISDNQVRAAHSSGHDEYSPWSIQRIKSYQITLSKPVESLTVLRIPMLHSEVPVLEGTDEFTFKVF